MKRDGKIYATKKRLLDQLGDISTDRYKDHTAVSEAMQSIVDALCQCAVSRHVSGGMIFSVTSDKMEWQVRYEQMGKRNSKTGKIT